MTGNLSPPGGKFAAGLRACSHKMLRRKSRGIHFTGWSCPRKNPRRKRIQGWSAGIPTLSEDTLRLAELTDARPMIEKYPLAKAAEAYARMMSGKAEFRVVLTM